MFVLKCLHLNLTTCSYLRHGISRKLGILSLLCNMREVLAHTLAQDAFVEPIKADNVLCRRVTQATL